MNYLNTEKDKIQDVVLSLNILLADYHIYYQNLRNFHWNIVGKHFFDLHSKFEALYTDARLKIDEIAERILTLQFHPVSSYSDYLKLSTVEEAPIASDEQSIIETLLQNHKIILEEMFEIIEKAEIANDQGTIDLMGGYIRTLEKESWMLNAWTKKPSNTFKKHTVNK